VSAQRSFAAVLVLALAGVVAAGTVDKSIGVCTRKDEFAKRQEALDAKVKALAEAKDEAKRKKAAAALATAAEADVECLIRYRERHLLPALVKVLEGSKKWFTRARAAYGLKMLGDRAAVPALVRALRDADASVREAAASALGHLGGSEAKAALEERAAVEKDPYALATVESASGLAGLEEKPYRAWTETLAGPEGARRVEWVWTWKGQSSFNEYDAKTVDYPVATRFVYPIQRYEEDLFAGYPRRSFGAGGNHAGEDCAWFREGLGYFAIADGVVRMVQGAGGDWGFLVVLEHRLPDGRYLVSVYGHAAFDVLVKPGDVVKAGQRIATQGLSCSVENGGYGSHLHFGLGDGPFRRPAGLATGDLVNADLGGGKAEKVPVLRLGYAAEAKNSLGWPLTAFVVRNADGSERTVEIPEQPVAQEIGWFQAYAKGCRGWLDPQTLLPELVEGKGRGK